MRGPRPCRFGRWSFHRDRSGSAAPLFGLAITAILGFAGLTVDLGTVYLEKRRVQSTADLAAVMAASSVDAVSAARTTLTDNGYPQSTPMQVVTGSYAAKRTVPVDRRFSPGGTLPNAVKVTVNNTVKSTFSQIVGGPATYAVKGTATAFRDDLAAFGIGSRAVALDGGIINALLTQMLGAKVSLTAIDYRSLADAKIDAREFLQSASSRAHVQAMTFDDALKLSVSQQDYFGALSDAARKSSGGLQAVAALDKLSSAVAGGTGTIALDKIFYVGDFGALPLVDPDEPLLVNSLGMLSAGAALANGTRQINLDLGATIPGLLSAKVTMRVGEGWTTSGFVAPGAALNTAQVRLLIDVQVPGVLGLASLRLPIYVEVGSAQARLDQVGCPWSARTDRSARVQASSGTAYLAIGSVPTSSLDPNAPRPPLTSATIVDTLLLPLLQGQASMEIGISSGSLTFSNSEIQAATLKTVTANGQLTGATARLLSNLRLTLGGLPVTITTGPVGSVLTSLSAATAPVDNLLFSILSALGLEIGAVDIAVLGTHCGGGALVQ